MNPVADRSSVPPILRRMARRVLASRALNENVSVGVGLRAGRGVVISAPHGMDIGRWVSIGPRTTIQVNGSIGDFCLIGMSVQICGRRDHAIDEIGTPILTSTWVGDRAPSPHDSVTIGSDVWIGGHSTVLSGVTIGTGSVIGAASVVTKSIPEFAIAVGNPARVVGMRFETESERTQHVLALKDLATSMGADIEGISGT
jgi:acetyltransferase-like isoleucine patch superfamily enzyme